MTASPHAPSPERSRPLWAINSLARCGDACGSLPSTPHVPHSCTNSRKHPHSGRQGVKGPSPRDKAKLHQSGQGTAEAERQAADGLSPGTETEMRPGECGAVRGGAGSSKRVLGSPGEEPVRAGRPRLRQAKEQQHLQGLEGPLTPVCLLLIGASQPQGWAPGEGAQCREFPRITQFCFQQKHRLSRTWEPRA